MAQSKEDRTILNALPKDARIQAEYNRLVQLYEDAPEKQLALAKKLIANAAFMAILLDDLAKLVTKAGATEPYQNGANQHGKKTSSELQSYNSTLKNYASAVKQLNDMLVKLQKSEPDQEPEYEPDEFDRF